MLLWLQGPGFGGSGGDTVATDASNMSDKWYSAGPQQSVNNGTTMSDMIDAGGKGYNMITDNCLGATSNMMNRATGPKKWTMKS